MGNSNHNIVIQKFLCMKLLCSTAGQRLPPLFSTDPCHVYLSKKNAICEQMKCYKAISILIDSESVWRT